MWLFNSKPSRGFSCDLVSHTEIIVLTMDYKALWLVCLLLHPPTPFLACLLLFLFSLASLYCFEKTELSLYKEFFSNSFSLKFLHWDYCVARLQFLVCSNVTKDCLGHVCQTPVLTLTSAHSNPMIISLQILFMIVH